MAESNGERASVILDEAAVEASDSTARTSTRDEGLFRTAAIRARGRNNPRSVLRVPWAAGAGYKRVPVVLQTTPSSCGAACLSMLLSSLGHGTSLTAAQDKLAATRDGSSAFDLIAAAREAGVELQGVRVDADDLEWVPVPAILHWDLNHFVVLEGVRRGRFTVVDPSIGRRVVSRPEVDASFTGIAITVGSCSGARSTISSAVDWRYYVRAVLRHPLELVRAFVLTGTLQGLGLIVPAFTAIIVDEVIPRQHPGAIELIALGGAVGVAAWIGVTIARGVTLGRLQTRLDKYLMEEFFEHLLRLPYSFFEVRLTGDLMMRITSNAVVRDVLSRQVLSLLTDGLLVVGYSAAVIWVNARLGVALLGIVTCQCCLVAVAHYATRDAVQREVLAQAKHHSYLAEVLTGIETIKASGAEAKIGAQWRDVLCGELEASYRRLVRGTTYNALLAGVSYATPLVFLGLGADAVLSGRLSLGQMLAASALGMAAGAPLNNLIGNTQGLQLVRTHLERLDEVRLTPTERINGVARPPRLSGHVELRDVSFRYSKRSADVIRDACLVARPGEMVAIVGRSGSGKTTLLKLILGLVEPSHGAVLVDGCDVRSLDLRSVRAQCGVVLQRSTLFAESIRANIVLRAPQASEDEVWTAARLACVDEEIRRMPMGLETVVSERGGNLSGGQRQRLCLARALIGAPRVLLLDEATSEVDAAAEAAIYENLRRLDCTLVVVAHRLSTVRGADQIIVVEDGVIVERGRHDDMVLRGQRYAQLVRFQQIARGAE